MNIILLHHAGGDKYSFNNLIRMLPPQIEGIALEVPGRGDRFGEPLLTDTDAIINDMYKQLTPYIQRPYMMLGFSMGTLVAFLLMEKIRNAGKSLPTHTFMFARESPDYFIGQFDQYKYESKAFWDCIVNFGGVPKALLQHPELMELYEPIMRADFEALGKYVYQEVKPFNVNATVVLGEKDKVKDEHAKTWQKHFIPEIEMVKMDGGHFFIFENIEAVSKLIKSKLK